MIRRWVSGLALAAVVVTLATGCTGGSKGRNLDQDRPKASGKQ